MGSPISKPLLYPLSYGGSATGYLGTGLIHGTMPFQPTLISSYA